MHALRCLYFSIKRELSCWLRENNVDIGIRQAPRMEAAATAGGTQNVKQPIDVLAAFQTISGKAVECISVFCIVPFAEGLVDDIISCDSSVSVRVQA
jgi:hypothetical protein